MVFKKVLHQLRPQGLSSSRPMERERERDPSFERPVSRVWSRIRSNWNIEMLIFGRGKTGELGEKTLGEE